MLKLDTYNIIRFSPIWTQILIVVLKVVIYAKSGVLPEEITWKLPELIAFGGLSFVVWGFSTTATKGSSREIEGLEGITESARRRRVTNELLLLFALMIAQLSTTLATCHATFNNRHYLSIAILVSVIMAYFLPVMYLSIGIELNSENQDDPQGTNQI